MIKKTFICLALFASVTCGNIANADLIFSFDESTPGSGSDRVIEGEGGNITLGVFARLAIDGDTSIDTFESYDLFIDIGADGMGLPDGVGFGTPRVMAGEVFSNSAENIGSAGTLPLAIADLHISADRAPFVFTTTNTKLFDINLLIDSSTPAGEFAISFRDDSGFLAAVNDGADNLVNTNPEALDFQTGSVIVASAVPEPSSLTLLLLVMAGVGVRRFR